MKGLWISYNGLSWKNMWKPFNDSNSLVCFWNLYINVEINIKFNFSSRYKPMFLTWCTSNWHCIKSISRVTYLVGFSGKYNFLCLLGFSTCMQILKFFSDLYLVDQLAYWGHSQLKTVKCHLQEFNCRF